MSYKYFISIFCLIIICSGCISTSKVLEKPPYDLVIGNQAVINSTYLNKSIDSTGYSGTTLWTQLYFHKLWRSPKVTIPDDAVVSIVYRKNNRLKATAIVNGIVIDSLQLKVFELKDCIAVKRRLLFIPIPFLFFVHQEKKIFLGSTQEGNLVLKTGDYLFAWVFLFAVGGSESQQSFIFKRIFK